jgi:hypothetical protein
VPKPTSTATAEWLVDVPRGCAPATSHTLPPLMRLYGGLQLLRALAVHAAADIKGPTVENVAPILTVPPHASSPAELSSRSSAVSALS